MSNHMMTITEIREWIVDHPKSPIYANIQIISFPKKQSYLTMLDKDSFLITLKTIAYEHNDNYPIPAYPLYSDWQNTPFIIAEYPNNVIR